MGIRHHRSLGLGQLLTLQHETVPRRTLPRPIPVHAEDNGALFFDFPVDLPVQLRDARLIINPGSVGQPRDGLPTASYALFDSDEQTITHYRAEYDISETQKRMTERNLPQYLIDRLARGR